MPSYVSVDAAAVGVAAVVSLATIAPVNVTLGADAGLHGHTFAVYGVSNSGATAASPNKVWLCDWTVPPGSAPAAPPKVDGFSYLMFVRKTAGTATGKLRVSGATAWINEDLQAVPAVGSWLGAPVKLNKAKTRFMLDPGATDADVVEVWQGQDSTATNGNGSTLVAKLKGGGGSVEVLGYGYVQIRTVSRSAVAFVNIIYWDETNDGGTAIEADPGTVALRDGDGYLNAVGLDVVTGVTLSGTTGTAPIDVGAAGVAYTEEAADHAGNTFSVCATNVINPPVDALFAIVNLALLSAAGVAVQVEVIVNGVTKITKGFGVYSTGMPLNFTWAGVLPVTKAAANAISVKVTGLQGQALTLNAASAPNLQWANLALDYTPRGLA